VSGPAIAVGLVGNPNCGKTTLLNRLCHARENVGNYPRVTVEAHEYAVVWRDQQIRVIDLPGIYALTTQSPEERVARDVIHAGKDQPSSLDVIVNILDAGNLERSLFLTSQLVEMGRPTIFVLNMIDEATRKGLKIDTVALEQMCGGPVIPTNGITGEGLERLQDAILEVARRINPPRPVLIQYDQHLEDAVVMVQKYLHDLHPQAMTDAQTRWLAIKLLEGDEAMLRAEGEHDHLLEMVRRARYDLALDHGGECEMLFADARYGFVHGMITEVLTVTDDPASRYDLTRKLDGLFLHRVLGIPIFLALLWMMFQATFTLGEYPMNWIDAGVAVVSEWVAGMIPEGMTHDLVVNGVLAGVGGTIVFLPNIVILFFFMAVFSETGYLTRAAFLMDRVMHAFGLHGKALIPLVMGFGCNVPAIMATRTIESNRSRLITILISPFMLCAARLPVFILFAGAFFSEQAGTVVFLMYMLSIGFAVAASVFLNRVFDQGEHEAFVMELPPYRMPTLRAVLIHMWDKALSFLQKIAGVILVGSIVIWFLQEFPKDIAWSTDYPARIEQLQAQPESPEREDALGKLALARTQEALEKSYLGQIAHVVAPVFEPLGFTWKDTVAILTGFVAKEVVVASYAVIYAQDAEGAEESGTLREALAGAMSPVTAFTFMVFALLYAPCLATIAAIRREAEGWKWAGFSVVFSLSVAYSAAWVIMHLGRLVL
jgi:ferrous iron transport protein B